MKRSTRGFTLVELILAMALMSTLLTVVAVALGGLARLIESRDRIDRERNIQQFVMQLRQDIHEAGTCTISPVDDASSNDDVDSDAAAPKQTLALAGDDGRVVRFQPTQSGLTRIVTRDDAELHRESYVWGAQATATWTKDETHALPMVILTLAIDGGLERPAERHVVPTTLLNSQAKPEE